MAPKLRPVRARSIGEANGTGRGWPAKRTLSTFHFPLAGAGRRIGFVVVVAAMRRRRPRRPLQRPDYRQPDIQFTVLFPEPRSCRSNQPFGWIYTLWVSISVFLPMAAPAR